MNAAAIRLKRFRFVLEFEDVFVRLFPLRGQAGETIVLIGRRRREDVQISRGGGVLDHFALVHGLAYLGLVASHYGTVGI
jgi:hypothetical protein